MNQTEAELERFRQQWRDEVSARGKSGGGRDGQGRVANQGNISSGPSTTKKKQPSTAKRRSRHEPIDGDEVGTPVALDVEARPTGHVLSNKHAVASTTKQDPVTALEHYERAVEREGAGSLGESVKLYRQAFRMDDQVHEMYKNKHFPPAAPKPAALSKVKVPNEQRAAGPEEGTAQRSLAVLPPTLAELLADFSELSIATAPPPTEFSPPPPCPIAALPEEILVEIMLHLAIGDVGSIARLSQVCKRLAFLVISEDRIWRRLAVSKEYGFAGMHYRFACNILGIPLSTYDMDGDGNYTLEDLSSTIAAPLPYIEDVNGTPLPLMPLTATYPTYRTMYKMRPRIRFSGCYISTVNYSRPGASSASNFTWNSSILIVTYYRYLRFFRDGSCISLLTTAEPADVVPYLQREHLHRSHTGALPQAVMKDALKGRWRLTGDPYKTTAATAGGDIKAKAEGQAEEEVEEEVEEEEGSLIIETEGVVPKYTYKMQLDFASAGRGARNNKLAWRGFWNYNKLTDDWGEFGLKNYKAFYWSRVKSYGKGE